MFGSKKYRETKTKEEKVDLEIPLKSEVKTLPSAPKKNVKQEEDVKEAVVEEELVEEVEEVPEPKVIQDTKEPEEEEPEELEEPVEIKPFAQIVSGEILENGLHRYIVVSNKSIGAVGEVFPLD